MSSKHALISPPSSHSDDDSMPLASRKLKFQTKTEKTQELTSNKRKNPFERVFNKDDEILVLRGIVDYKLKTGRDYGSSPDEFYESIDASLSSGITKKQVIGKIRRLRYNFFNYFKQGRDDRTVEDEFYQLGLKIWGDIEVVKDEKRNVICKGKGGEVVKDEKRNVISKGGEVVKDEKRNVIISKGGEVVKEDEKRNIISKGGECEVVKDEKRNIISKGGEVVKDEKRNIISKGGEVVKDEKECVKEEKMVVKKVEERLEVETGVKDCWSLYPNVCESLESGVLKNFGRRREYVQEVVSGLGADKAGELEEEWMGVRVMEVKVFAEKAKVLAKQAKALLDVLASRGEM